MEQDETGLIRRLPKRESNSTNYGSMGETYRETIRAEQLRSVNGTSEHKYTRWHMVGDLFAAARIVLPLTTIVAQAVVAKLTEGVTVGEQKTLPEEQTVQQIKNEWKNNKYMCQLIGLFDALPGSQSQFVFLAKQSLTKLHLARMQDNKMKWAIIFILTCSLKHLDAAGKDTINQCIRDVEESALENTSVPSLRK